MKPVIPEELMGLSDIEEFDEATILRTSQTLVDQYEDFKCKVRDGKLGKTAKFIFRWVICYGVTAFDSFLK